MNRSTYTVRGMTCGHCVEAVSDSLQALPGVSQVEVDLVTGHVTVTSDHELSTDDVHTAVIDAGYELATDV